MKSIGIVRKIDELGRVVIPKSLRKDLNLKEKKDLTDGDPVEIYVDGEAIILKKYRPGCVFCGEVKDVKNFKGKYICADCLEDIKANKN